MAKRIYLDGEFEDWSKSDWDDYIEERAEKIADQRIQWNLSVGWKTREGDRKKYVDEYKRRMLRDYPYEKLDGNVFQAISKMDDHSAMEWLDGYGVDPMKRLKQEEFEKFAPILQGVAEKGKDWYSMGSVPLQAFGAELGYKTGTKEGFKEFLDKVASMQKEYDRASVVKEMGDEYPVRSAIAKVALPTLYRGIENAVADPEAHDLSTGEAIALGALDTGVNAGMLLAPSVSMPVRAISSRPLVNATADAVLQGILEEGRQLGAESIADVEPDYFAAPITAVTAGATRPALIGSAQGLMSGFTGPQAMSFRRGLMGSMRTGNPVFQERQALENSIDEFNRRMAENIEREAVRGQSGKVLDVFLDEAEKNAALRANMPAKLSKQLGIGRKVGGAKVQNKTLSLFDNPEKQVARRQQKLFLDKDAILKAYDKVNPQVSVRFKDGIATVNKTIPKESIGSMLMGGDRESKLRALIPNKFAELEGMDKGYRAGMKAGEILGDVGGRVEPAFKVNPLNPFRNSPLTTKPGDYKDTQWYRGLSDRSKEIVDAVFTGKKKKQSGN